MNLSLLLPKNQFNVKPEAQNKTVKRQGIPMWLQRSAAAAIIVILSPIFLAAMLAVKLDSRGPVFFSQVRVGAFGRRFRCYKLRSMYLATDPKFRQPDPEQSSREGVCKKYVNDPRITPVGRIIRKLSIDELPQLFNVVKGDMALVGPRPNLVCEFEQYNADIYTRLYCEAGITGLWQVSGRADTTFEEQMSLDATYVNKQSFVMDMLILLKTIPAVAFSKGAY